MNTGCVPSSSRLRRKCCHRRRRNGLLRVAPLELDRDVGPPGDRCVEPATDPTSECESIESILFSSLVSGACSDVSGHRILGKQVWISPSRIRSRIRRSSGAVSGRFECRQAKCRSSGAAAPVFDAVVVGVKPWLTPQRTAWVRLPTSILR